VRRGVSWCTALAVLSACAGAPAPTPPAPLAPTPRLHLLTVGIEGYLDRALRQQGAEADAMAFADSVRAIARGAFEVVETRLVGPQASRAAVADAFATIAAAADSTDVFVFYYRGLGGPRFLVLADSLPLPPPPSAPGALAPESFERRLVRADALAGWLTALKPRAQFLVLDAPDAASFFHDLRPLLAGPPGSGAPSRDLTAFAMHGPPIEVEGRDGKVHGVLSESVLHALGAERDSALVVLASSVAMRVLARLDHPVMVHQAGADVVLGARDAAEGRAGAVAMRTMAPWGAACAGPCPRITLLRVENTYTLVGRAEGLPAGAMLFVNGRRTRLTEERFEVEVAPAALRAPLRVRVLLPDGGRFETVARLP
jgi:hypothetical protein